MHKKNILNSYKINSNFFYIIIFITSFLFFYLKKDNQIEIRNKNTKFDLFNLITKVESTQTKRLIYFTKTDGNDFKYPFTAWVDMDNDKTPETQFFFLKDGSVYYDYSGKHGLPNTFAYKPKK